jgi:hypothetical protein
MVEELPEAAAAGEHARQNFRRAAAHLRRRGLAATLQLFVLQLLDTLPTLG